MDFSTLQQSWQAQGGLPPGVPAPLLLSDTQRLHRLSKRRNRWFALILVPYWLFLWHLFQGYAAPSQLVGEAILALALPLLTGVRWWGTTLRQAAQPGIASRAYVQASLRAFRFWHQTLHWLAVPYGLLLGLGWLLIKLPAIQTQAGAWWQILFLLAGGGAMGLVLRHFGLKKYQQEFGPTVQTLEYWQAAWPEEPAAPDA